MAKFRRFIGKYDMGDANYVPCELSLSESEPVLKVMTYTNRGEHSEDVAVYGEKFYTTYNLNINTKETATGFGYPTPEERDADFKRACKVFGIEIV